MMSMMQRWFPAPIRLWYGMALGGLSLMLVQAVGATPPMPLPGAVSPVVSVDAPMCSDGHGGQRQHSAALQESQKLYAQPAADLGRPVAHQHTIEGPKHHTIPDAQPQLVAWPPRP